MPNKTIKTGVYTLSHTSFGNRQPHWGNGRPSIPNGQGASSPGMPYSEGSKNVQISVDNRSYSK